MVDGCRRRPDSESLGALALDHRFLGFGLTAGAGFRAGVLSVDYAFMDNSNDLEDNHRFSLSFGFLP